MSTLATIILAALISGMACTLDFFASVLTGAEVDRVRIIVLGPLFFVLALLVLALPS